MADARRYGVRRLRALSVGSAGDETKLPPAEGEVPEMPVGFEDLYLNGRWLEGPPQCKIERVFRRRDDLPHGERVCRAILSGLVRGLPVAWIHRDIAPLMAGWDDTDRIGEDSLARSKINRPPVIRIYQAEIPQLITLIDIGNARASDFQ